MVRKHSLILSAVIVVLGFALVACRHASPTIVLVNESATIYFSQQAVDGVATLGLISDGNTVSEGEFAYNREGQLFRKIIITLLSDGTVAATVSG